MLNLNKNNFIIFLNNSTFKSNNVTYKYKNVVLTPFSMQLSHPVYAKF